MRFPRRQRRRLRWRRLLLPILTAAAAMAVVYVLQTDGADLRSVIGMVKSPEPENVAKALETDDTTYMVTKKNIYVCGEETIDLGEWTGRQIAEKIKQEPEWQIDRTGDQQVILSEEIEDLSPDCKSNAYFGLDNEGNLTLFDGLPEYNRVLRTFFQIDIEYLKSSLPQETVNQLYNGIKITEYEDYNSVISTFADYAVSRPAS